MKSPGSHKNALLTLSRAYCFHTQSNSEIEFSFNLKENSIYKFVISSHNHKKISKKKYQYTNNFHYTVFRLVHNQKKNCRCDHIPFNLKVIINRFLWVYVVDDFFCSVPYWTFVIIFTISYYFWNGILFRLVPKKREGKKNHKCSKWRRRRFAYMCT